MIFSEPRSPIELMTDLEAAELRFSSTNDIILKVWCSMSILVPEVIHSKEAFGVNELYGSRK